MQNEKSRLRQSMRPKLVAITPSWRWEASQALVKRVTSLEKWRMSRVIGLFAGRNDEMETSLLWSAEKSFVYPKMTDDKLHFLAVDSHLSLQIGRWDVHEPTGGDVVIPDLVLVPGLAFDAQGGRLGRGKGFYDRWLIAHPHVATLGVCFDFQIVEKIPMEAHDRVVNSVVTESQIYSP